MGGLLTHLSGATCGTQTAKPLFEMGAQGIAAIEASSSPLVRLEDELIDQVEKLVSEQPTKVQIHEATSVGGRRRDHVDSASCKSRTLQSTLPVDGSHTRVAKLCHPLAKPVNAHAFSVSLSHMQRGRSSDAMRKVGHLQASPFPAKSNTPPVKSISRSHAGSVTKASGSGSPQDTTTSAGSKGKRACQDERAPKCALRSAAEEQRTILDRSRLALDRLHEDDLLTGSLSRLLTHFRSTTLLTLALLLAPFRSMTLLTLALLLAPYGKATVEHCRCALDSCWCALDKAS